MLAMRARKGGQNKGVVFDIPHLIQSFHVEGKECGTHKSYVSYHVSY